MSSIFYSLFPLPNETVLHHSIVLEGCGNIDADIFDRGPYLTEKEKNRDSIFSRKEVRNVRRTLETGDLNLGDRRSEWLRVHCGTTCNYLHCSKDGICLE